MDDAGRVLDRLRRIEALEQQNAPPLTVLGELRELLVEAEAWVRSEAAGDPAARAAVDALGRALNPVEATDPAAERSLVA
jgi:hypothetical protein